MTSGDPPIVDLRAKVRDERAPLVELSARVSPDIQKLLKPASNLLDDVEGFFLAPEVMQHPPRSDNKWPNGSAMLPTYYPSGVVRRSYVPEMSCAILPGIWLDMDRLALLGLG